MALAEVVRLIGPPEADGEYVALRQHGSDEQIVHLHDYDRLYEVPGLYEQIVQELLRCRSPQVAADGLALALTALELDPVDLTVLDLGAGTGLVGELARAHGVGSVVGLDTLPAARDACIRDRPATYSEYLVGDLANPTRQLLARLRDLRLTGLISAGAFGGTHAPATALVRAIKLLGAGAPVVLTIDERWMTSDGGGGFRTAVARLLKTDRLRLLERSRFQHRLTTTGVPIHYELLVGAVG
jgi:SAM-dependent methyltransferase